MVRRIGYGLLALAVMAAPALAHPHVVVGVTTEVVLDAAGKVTGLLQHWHFDKGYTDSALEDMDTNHDGTFSAEELQPLTAENMKSLKDYDYFTVIRQKGEAVAILDPADAEQTWAKGLLSLHFTLPLAQPLDPKDGEVVAKVYDPEFFISFVLPESEGASAKGTLPAGCTLSVKPVPTDAELDSTRAMLATKGMDWQPENNEDFGALFAQPISLSCAS